MSALSRLTCVFLISLMTACAGSWTPPATPEGRLCVRECAMSKGRCEGGLQMAIANCANQVQTQLHAYDDPQIDSETACADDPAVDTAFSSCEHRYRNCFVGCGGVIEQ